ncbi:MAG TPA: hypothetical protein VLN46_02415 [Gillisia sp.]|nr:hypothetical protein [Gillisia sp.]
MYYFLYYDISGDEARFYKQEFSNRISRREKIKQEIEGCLREILPVAEGSRLYKLMHFFSPAVFAFDYYFHHIFYGVDIERCQYYEMKNIDMYYVFLYAGTGNENIIDMLLEQKSIIENRVFSEI